MLASEVLSTLLKPTIVLSIPETVPVNVGEAKGAFKSNAVCVAVETGLLASEVLSTLLKPTIVLSIPETVPVNVGLLIGAFKDSAAFALVISAAIAVALAVTLAVNVASAAVALFTSVVKSVVFAFNANPGTVGAAAVPPKSPAN